MDAQLKTSVEIVSRNPEKPNVDKKEPKMKQQAWLHYLKRRIQLSVILAVAFFIILILLLNNSYKLISQNEKILETKSHLQNRIKHIEEKLGTFEVSKDYKTEIHRRNHEKTISGIELNDGTREITNKEIQVSTTGKKPILAESPAQTEKMEPLSTVEPNIKTQMGWKLSSKTYSNVANYLSGAKVDRGSSSRATDYSIFTIRDQSAYVLIDREPVSHKAWCTEEYEPVLTIELSKNVRPISVSYQHLKWNDKVPNGAPKFYDVLTCFDEKCNKTVLLVSKCEYTSSGEQEQFCSISYNKILPETNKIRFRFRENHGNSTETCAYLVRLFEEGIQIKEDSKTKKEASEEVCSSLTWYHKNIKIIYNYWLHKDCKTLYNNDCCMECPECCTECEIEDLNKSVFWSCFLIFAFFTFSFFIVFLEICSRNRPKTINPKAYRVFE